VNKDLLHNKKYSIRYYLCSALKETCEAVWALFKLDFKELRLELEQLVFGVQMMYHQYFEKDFKLVFCSGAVEEYYDRRVIWLSIFDLFDKEFKVEYMEGGTNFRKPRKIKQALALAGVEISDLQARILARKYSISLYNAKRLGLL
jgi:hypothetical protein